MDYPCTPDLFAPLASDCRALPFVDADPHMGRLSREEADVLREAEAILARRIRAPGVILNMPALVKDYLRMKIGARDREVFVVLFFDSQNGLISADEMFLGTLSLVHIYPREIARRALLLNAAAVLFAHCHPSTVVEPSEADKAITKTLVGVLEPFDVRVLDHIIVAGNLSYSFTEHGLL